MVDPYPAHIELQRTSGVLWELDRLNQAGYLASYGTTVVPIYGVDTRSQAMPQAFGYIADDPSDKQGKESEQTYTREAELMAQEPAKHLFCPWS